MHVFSNKMQAMGVDIHWQISGEYIIIQSDMGICNILLKALHYCFEDQYKFDHKGNANIIGPAPRPVCQDDDEILHMYHKWQKQIERRKSF